MWWSWTARVPVLLHGQGGPGDAVELNWYVSFELYFHVCTGFNFFPLNLRLRMNVDCLNSRITCLSFFSSHPYSINKCQKRDSFHFGHIISFWRPPITWGCSCGGRMWVFGWDLLLQGLVHTGGRQLSACTFCQEKYFGVFHRREGGETCLGWFCIQII